MDLPLAVDLVVRLGMSLHAVRIAVTTMAEAVVATMTPMATAVVVTAITDTKAVVVAIMICMMVRHDQITTPPTTTIWPWMPRSLQVLLLALAIRFTFAM
jgi:hypothetical protein